MHLVFEDVQAALELGVSHQVCDKSGLQEREGRMRGSDHQLGRRSAKSTPWRPKRGGEEAFWRTSSMTGPRAALTRTASGCGERNRRLADTHSSPRPPEVWHKYKSFRI